MEDGGRSKLSWFALGFLMGHLLERYGLFQKARILLGLERYMPPIEGWREEWESQEEVVR